MQAAVEQLERRRDQLAAAGNAAEALARRIGRTMPLFYGAGPIGAVAAMRWKCDVNENAKAPAFYNRVPELCHNEVAGWGQHGDVTRQVFTIVNLRHDHEHPHLARRFELVNSLEEEVVVGIEEVRAEGEGPLAQLFDLVLYGDLVSLGDGRASGGRPRPDRRVGVHQGVAQRLPMIQSRSRVPDCLRRQGRRLRRRDHD